MTERLQPCWRNRVIDLNRTRLSTTGITITECFMLAQQHGRGTNNRETLAIRLRMAAPEQRDAALKLFDDFCKAKGI